MLIWRRSTLFPCIYEKLCALQPIITEVYVQSYRQMRKDTPQRGAGRELWWLALPGFFFLAHSQPSIIGTQDPDKLTR